MEIKEEPTMTVPNPNPEQLARRAFLGRACYGLGAMALGSLLNPGRASAADEIKLDKWPGVITAPHVPAKAKRVIFLYQAGGPSHLETFDYKPQLEKMNGQPMPDSYTKGKPIAQLQGQQLKCLAPQHGFKKYGQSGQEMSELFPHIGGVADDICIIRSVKTEQINHDPAHTFMNTGASVSGRPSMGSWITYGLGSACDNLPGFVVLTSAGRGGQMQPIASRQWHNGFLPSRCCTSAALTASTKGSSRMSCARSRSSIRNSVAALTIPKFRRASASTKWLSACSPAFRN
jgi:hypothetical protein